MSSPSIAQYADSGLLSFLANYLMTSVDGVGDWGRTPSGELRRPATTYLLNLEANGAEFTGPIVNPSTVGPIFGSATSTSLINLIIQSTAGRERAVQFNTGVIRRWRIVASAGAESGANAGSDLLFTSYDDVGTLIGIALNINRATLTAKFDDEVDIGGALNHDGTTAGFYGTAPIVKQVGVPVTAAGVHAALTALGLIAP